MELNAAVKRIRPLFYQGSSIRRNTVYHALPFEEYKISSHRKDTLSRWSLISNYIDFYNKFVIDIGCNIGGFSMLSSLTGAKNVCGYDYDKESLDIGKILIRLKEIKNVNLIEKNIDLKFANELEECDIILWLSQWMWCVKQQGMNIAKEMLKIISSKTKIMVFESSAEDGMAGIKGMTQNDVYEYLKESSGFKTIFNAGVCNDWGKRNIYICK